MCYSLHVAVSVCINCNFLHLLLECSSSRKQLDSCFQVFKLSLRLQRLLVTSSKPPCLHQYSTVDGQLLRVVNLPSYVQYLEYAVETTRGTFVVSHEGTAQDTGRWAVS